MDNDNNSAVTLTKLERQYIRAIINDDYQADPDCPFTPVWAWSPAEEFGASAGGIASSLQKKGYVECCGAGQDATIELTREGFAAYQAV